jgi:putative membrane protein
MNLYVNFLSYAGVGLLMMLIGLALFELTTKNEKFKMIGQGNTTAAMVIGGKMLGLAVVIGSAIANSISLVDMVIWGTIGIIFQIIAHLLAEVVTIRFSIKDAIDLDNRAVGVFLLLMSLSIGWVIAQSLTY